MYFRYFDWFGKYNRPESDNSAETAQNPKKTGPTKNKRFALTLNHQSKKHFIKYMKSEGKYGLFALERFKVTSQGLLLRGQNDKYPYQIGLCL